MAKKVQPLPASPVQTSAPVAAVKADLVAILTTDEFAGHGGSYVLDPATGQRKRQQDPEPDPKPE
jgi:hypothetical protein